MARCREKHAAHIGHGVSNGDLMSLPESELRDLVARQNADRSNNDETLFATIAPIRLNSVNWQQQATFLSRELLKNSQIRFVPDEILHVIDRHIGSR